MRTIPVILALIFVVSGMLYAQNTIYPSVVDILTFDNEESAKIYAISKAEEAIYTEILSLADSMLRDEKGVRIPAFEHITEKDVAVVFMAVLITRLENYKVSENTLSLELVIEPITGKEFDLVGNILQNKDIKDFLASDYSLFSTILHSADRARGKIPGYTEQSQIDTAAKNYMVDITKLTDYNSYFKGRSRLFQGMRKEADVYFKEMLERDSVSEYFQTKIAKLYLFTNNTEIALRHFLNIQKKYPQSSEAFYLTGICYILLGNQEKAIETFDKSIQLDNKKKEAYFQLGNIYLDQKKHDKAVTLFLKLANQYYGEEKGEIYFVVANIYDKINDKQNTEKYLRISSELRYQPASEALKNIGR